MPKITKLLSLSVKVYIALFVFSTALIIYGTLFPVGYKMPKSTWNYDKVIHFVMFGAWTFFYGIIRLLKGKHALWPVFLWGVFFGVLIETLQYLLPTNRSAEFFDLVADVLGSGFAILLLYLLLRNVSNLRRGPVM